MAVHSAPRPLSTRQRAVLGSLLALSELTEFALGEGDVQALVALSTQRAQVVRGAAAYVPPCSPWEPELGDLVAEVEEHCRRVQHEVQATIEAFRRPAPVSLAARRAV